MATLELYPTRCAICNTEGNAAELYPANFDSQSLNPAVFSARRLPDRLHYRIVKCDRCGLVRSDPVVAAEVVSELYAKSSFDYDDETGNLRYTYGSYLKKLVTRGISKGALLEIGCGNGFFLEEALDQGFGKVCGVEPSNLAVEKAGIRVKPHIRCGTFRPGLFSAEEFDVICFFQVFDHIADPNVVLEECYKLLKPGGCVLCINHNIDAISAMLLGERSPIIDIEHTFLYSPETMAAIFSAHGFRMERSGSAWNVYSLRYLARMLPLPAGLKSALLRFLSQSRIGRARLLAWLGNMFVIARKSAAVGASGEQVFNRDVQRNQGYVYTTNAGLSSQMANQRMTDVALELCGIEGKRVIDIGCGDGTYTLELFRCGNPLAIHGVDAAEEAIKVAKLKTSDKRITFSACSAYQLPCESDSFDIAYLRGVLHHLDQPEQALREALRVAPTLIVIEPNGYSPILKLLERYSRYHVEHQERSYSAAVLNGWVQNLGGTVVSRKWAGLVPMFCPSWFAMTLKCIEPVVEHFPGVRLMGCAVYVFVAQRKRERR